MDERTSPSSRGEKGRVRLLSYNVHQCVGSGGHPDTALVGRILRASDSDVAGLQEVRNRYRGGPDAVQLDVLADLAGMQAFGGPTMEHSDGDYGNALLTRHPVRSIRRLDLSFPGREPRGAIDAELDADGIPLRVIVTHLGLRPAERRFQVLRLIEALDASPVRPVVLLGDLNEWFHLGRPARWLHRHFGRSPHLRTFPAIFPIIPLDRIMVRPDRALLETRVIDSPDTRRASDHLPVQAVVALD